jgi:hypothetical protein
MSCTWCSCCSAYQGCSTSSSPVCMQVGWLWAGEAGGEQHEGLCIDMGSAILMHTRTLEQVREMAVSGWCCGKLSLDGTTCKQGTCHPTTPASLCTHLALVSLQLLVWPPSAPPPPSPIAPTPSSSPHTWPSPPSRLPPSPHNKTPTHPPGAGQPAAPQKRIAARPTPGQAPGPAAVDQEGAQGRCCRCCCCLWHLLLLLLTRWVVSPACS